MRVAFRVDSSSEIGTGHLVRCLSLADALVENGAAVEFLCRDLPGNVAHLARARGHEVRLLRREPADWESDAAESREATGAQVDWLVVDSYRLDARWEASMRPRARRILVIDDLADRPHDCDLLVDQNLYPNAEERYRGRVPTACGTLLGPRYAILSRAFAASPPAEARAGEVRRILVCFGGADASKQTVKALEALRAVGGDELSIDVVVGDANPDKDAARAAANATPGATFAVQVADMPERMRRADLAIGAGGTSSWERCRSGLPCVTIVIADNQWEPSRALADHGASLLLGRDADVRVADIAAAVQLCLRSPTLVRHLSRRALELVDGKGAERVSRALMAPAVTLRPATVLDLERVHHWRNDPVVRAMSHDSAPIALETHRRWFTAALEDPRRVLLIAEETGGEGSGEGVGVLRYDLQGGEARTSIFLAPGRAGRGLATAMLRQGTRWLSERHPEVTALVAEILEHNAPSHAAFRAAGYSPTSSTLVLRKDAP